MAGFSLDILSRPDLTDPRVTYLLHEMGEETRHSRLFVRLLDPGAAESQEPARQPDRPHRAAARRDAVPHGHAVAVLPARAQRRGSARPPPEAGREHPDTDPMIKAVSKYHRQEEARHLAFARMLFPEQWAAAGPDRALPGPLPRLPHRHRDVRHHRAPGRLRHRRPPHVEDLARRQPLRRPHGHAPPCPAPAPHPAPRGEVFEGGRVPRGWQLACGVDRHGRDLASAEAA